MFIVATAHKIVINFCKYIFAEVFYSVLAASKNSRCAWCISFCTQNLWFIGGFKVHRVDCIAKTINKGLSLQANIRATRRGDAIKATYRDDKRDGFGPT